MIVGISGRQRCFKTGLGAVIACFELGKYEIVNGFGNLTLEKVPYSYSKLRSRELITRMFQAFNTGEEHLMFFVDEAHRILNPRMWKDWNKDDTFSLAGIFQDDKLSTVIIYTFHSGYEDEPLLGVDKMLRGATSVLINIESSERDVVESDAIIYYVKNRAIGAEYRSVLDKVSTYFNLFKTREPVF